jgi:hypothetical protein
MVIQMTALYTYAVARQKASGSAKPLEIEGIDPESTVYMLTLPQHSPHAQRAEVGAIVSAVPLAEFHPDVLKVRLSDTEWVQSHALAHQRVLAALLADYTVLPLQFCTLYNSEARVLEMITDNYDRFSTALDRLAGATEWGVKAFCNRAALIDWATSSSDELRPMRETISRMSEGASYMLRKRIASAARQLAESLERSCAEESHRRLSSIARAVVRHPPQPSDVHERPDEMVLNGAYLVDDQKQPCFEAELARLHEEYAAIGLTYELTGPWPPYSFATIEEET